MKYSVAKVTTGYKKKDQLFGFALTLPAIILLFLLFVFPVCYSLVLSFTDYNFVMSTELNFVGFKNYIDAFKNSAFQNSLRVTVLISVGALFCEFVFGIMLSAFVLHITRGKNFFKTVFLIPMMMAPTVAGLLFRFILNDEFGILNYMLKNLGIVSHNIPWLTNANLALVSIIIIDSWATIPLIFLLLFTALSDIPDTTLEAGRIDGASSLQIFFQIQLPIIRRSALLALFIRFMDVFRIYDSIYVLTKGGPGTATESLSLLIYRVNWMKYQLGSASSMSYIMMFFMFVVALVIQYYSNDKDERRNLWKRRKQA